MSGAVLRRCATCGLLEGTWAHDPSRSPWAHPFDWSLDAKETFTMLRHMFEPLLEFLDTHECCDVPAVVQVGHFFLQTWHDGYEHTGQLNEADTFRCLWCAELRAEDCEYEGAKAVALADAKAAEVGP